MTLRHAHRWPPLKEVGLPTWSTLGLIAMASGLLTAATSLGDVAAANWAASLPSDVRDIGLLVTAFGTSGYMFASSAMVAATAWWFGRSATDVALKARLGRLFDGATFVFIAVATSGLLAQLLKHVIGRVRPRVDGPDGAFASHPFSLANAYASFPSGHATSAFAAAAALGVMLPRGRPTLYGLAALIGASRVVVGEHYPSDVVGGAALGAIVSLALARAPPIPVLLSAVRAWAEQPWGPIHTARSPGRSWIVGVGTFVSRQRRWPVAALAAGCFAVAIPPGDLFGSETAEHVKDGCAILVALSGLTLRALTVGLGQIPPSEAPTRPAMPPLLTGGGYALCRNPLDAGTILIFVGIFLMHGNKWTVLLGTATYILIRYAVVRAEEQTLLARYGAAYADYQSRVARWLPDRHRLGVAVRGLAFDRRRVIDAEYPVIGLTLIALTLAEFYEEIEEPLVGGQVFYVVTLAAIILCITLAVGSIWVVKGRRLTFGHR